MPGSDSLSHCTYISISVHHALLELTCTHAAFRGSLSLPSSLKPSKRISSSQRLKSVSSHHLPLRPHHQPTNKIKDNSNIVGLASTLGFRLIAGVLVDRQSHPILRHQIPTGIGFFRRIWPKESNGRFSRLRRHPLWISRNSQLNYTSLRHSFLHW